MDEIEKKVLVTTRRQSKPPIFGDPCEFSENQLPNYNAVMKCYQLVKNEIKGSMKKMCLSLHQKRLKEYCTTNL